MIFARPPDGFKIVVAGNAKKLIDAACAKSPAFSRYWADITDRLKFVAHVEGIADERFKPGCRLWSASADEQRDLPRVRLLYQVLGDTVRIFVASVG